MAHRLAAVFAHPDDDTYCVGGTVALDRGDLEYTLVVATSGEAGPISDPTLATPETLAQVREREERESLAAVGADEASVHFLRYPDGVLSEVPHTELVDRVSSLLGEARPEVVVTFGPEGITRHDDHIAIHKVATDAFHALRAEEAGGGAFQRLLYASVAESDLNRLWEALRARGIEVGPPGAPFMPRGVPDHTVTVRADCSIVVSQKLDAIRAHRTQQVELDFLPEDLQPAFLRYESFVLAWPPVTDPSGPIMGSVFDGLEG